LKSKQKKFDEIAYKSTKGIKWQGMAEIFIRAIQFVTTIVLARLLLPLDFGLIAVALMFTQLAFVLFDFGLSTALIQKEKLENIHFTTTFAVYIWAALGLAVLVYVSAPWLAGFFKQEKLNAILRVLLIIFFFYAFSAIPRVKLIRSMRFKRFSILQSFSSLMYALTAISFALMDQGVWSFVYGILAEQFTLVLLLNIFSPWRPDWRFDKKVFKSLFSFGGQVIGSRLSAYVNNNTPTFSIGKWLGAGPLGFYSIAYQLVEFPVQRISKNVLRVIFPALSKLQNDRTGYHRLFGETVYYLALILLPVFAGIWLVAPEFVSLFYGEKWLPAIAPLQILTFAGLFRSFWVVNSVVFLSKGSPKTELIINLFYFVFLAGLLYFVLPSGVTAVAGAVAFSIGFFLIIGNIKALRMIKMPLAVLWRRLWVPLTGVAIFLIFNFLLLNFFLPAQSAWMSFGIKVLSSIALYLAFVYYTDRGIIGKLIAFLKA